MDLEKSVRWMKLELEKGKTTNDLELEKENVTLARFTEESGIMLPCLA